MLCLKANCKYKASSTCFCCSFHAAFPCNATTVSSWDLVTVHVAGEPTGTQRHKMPLGDARASQAEGPVQSTAVLPATSASHLLPPVPPVCSVSSARCQKYAPGCLVTAVVSPRRPGELQDTALCHM